MNTIIEQHRKLIEAIYNEDYYTNLFESLLISKQITNHSLLELSPSEMYKLWNGFWFSLPDSPSIRRYPFSDICNIIEQMECAFEQC